MHMFKCKLCGVKFKKKTELEDHIKDHLDSSHSSFMPGINYCMDCDLPLNNAYAFRNHTRQMHVSWIKFKIEDNVQICLCIKCDLTYECENEFNKH